MKRLKEKQNQDDIFHRKVNDQLSSQSYIFIEHQIKTNSEFKEIRETFITNAKNMISLRNIWMYMIKQ